MGIAGEWGEGWFKYWVASEELIPERKKRQVKETYRQKVIANPLINTPL